MKSIGIICEYNPFHNGHLYHLNRVKEMYPNYTIILVMSGHFLQRGDVSVINKWKKAEIALEAGVDLVIELPFVFATQSADIFAYGAVSILNYLNVEKIVFGSECDDIEKIKKLANVSNSVENYEKIRDYLSKGYSYAYALGKIIDIPVDNPNDILGISYTKIINDFHFNIEPICIKRTNSYNSKETSGSISSATSIRENIKNNKSISKFIPKYPKEYIDKVFIDDYFELLRYKIISSKDLSIYQTVDEGLENRIKKYIFEVDSL